MINRVFVYGTLMEGMENYWLLRPYVVSITPAFIAGAEIYHLAGGYPAVVFTGSPAQVKGQIMELRSIRKALTVLDGLEDFFGDGHPDNLYDREVKTAYSISGSEPAEAYVYVWAHPEQLIGIGKLVKGGCWRSFREHIQNINMELK